MPVLAPTGFNLVCATVGGFIATFGLVSFLLKEQLFLSESLISLVAGVLFSPHVTNLLDPAAYVGGDEAALAAATLSFSRLVLGVQLVIAGVQLPSRYLRREWRGLAYLLGPGMTSMWLSTGALVWAFVPGLRLLPALAVAACVAPTDPVLSNTIVKGSFADRNVPKDLQDMIVAESGSNDGLGYPFLFLPLLLVRHLYAGMGGAEAFGLSLWVWLYDTWVYQVLFGAAYGAAVGWAAKRLLHWAEDRKYVDRESFLVFVIALALFIVGSAGVMGTDDVLACFIAGNTFTWDDWFRQETLNDSLQPTMDMLLNFAIFMWFGAVCPWHKFVDGAAIPPARLFGLGVAVLLLRRPPVVLLLRGKVRQIREVRQGLFVGFFGPIGVSAIFYLYLSLEFLEKTARAVGGEEGEGTADMRKLAEVFTVVVWFLVICSVVVHGLAIPLGTLVFKLPKAVARGRRGQGLGDEVAGDASESSPLIDYDDEPDLPLAA